MRPGAATLFGLALVAVLSASAATAGLASPPSVSAGDFGHERFDRSTTIDNGWLPLRPGTQLVFQGTAVEGTRAHSHRIVSVVTDLTKTIAGIPAVVVWERDFSDGQLVEAELAFFAQDDDGNVWQLGEYPEEYEGGKVVDNPAWIQGVQHARAGLSMQARPRAGTPSYSLGWAPAVDFNDRAVVRGPAGTTCIPGRCYRSVLLVAEFNPGEPGRYQLKYYARGVGNVRVGWAGAKETSREKLVLTSRLRLTGMRLAHARDEALKLERRAYRMNRAVYGGTAPARRR